MAQDNDDQEAEIVPLRLLSGTPSELLERPTLSLANVKGLTRSKGILRKVIDDLSRTQRTDPVKSLLLYGPQNCGKTYLTRVLAGELGMNFLPISVSESVAIEEGARVVRDVVRIAERNTPCILYFDDIDAIQENQIELSVSTQQSIVDELLELLDNISNQSKTDLVVVASATYPWNLDSQLVGPTRFGEILLVLQPDKPARDAILRSALPHLSLNDDIDIDWLSDHTDGFSGVDLQRMVEIAISIAAQAGRSDPIMGDLRNAIHNMRPQAAAWLDHAAHHAMLSSHTGLYDDLLDYLHSRTR